MNCRRAIPAQPRSLQAYLMVECLVYIGVLFVVLGAGYVMLYRCIDSSVSLHRSADQITATLRMGERWRNDVRSATGVIQVGVDATGEVLVIPIDKGDIKYRLSENSLLRQFRSGHWTPVLTNVKSFSMQSDPREQIAPWCLEVELQPRQKASITRLRPLFSFTAVPPQSPAK